VRLKAMTRPPDLKDIDEQIEKLNVEKEAAVMEQDFEKAAHLRDRAEKLKKEKDKLTKDWRDKARRPTASSMKKHRRGRLQDDAACRSRRSARTRPSAC